MNMPSRNLNIAMLPLDMRLGDKERNLSLVTERVHDLPDDTDLVVLPELANTGFGTFSTDVSNLAEPDDGPTVTRICEISKDRNVAICGGFIGKSGGKLYNRCYFIADGKPLAFYSKRHLFSGPEQKIFSPGQELPPIVEYRSWKLRPVICYDLRFPVWLRSVRNNYDALIVMANWPNSRLYAWQHLIIARAIENQTYVAACNREGEDIYGAYGRGDSMLVNEVGTPVGTTLDNGTVIGTLKHESFNNVRAKLQPWRAADKFSLNI